MLRVEIIKTDKSNILTYKNETLDVQYMSIAQFENIFSKHLDLSKTSYDFEEKGFPLGYDKYIIIYPITEYIEPCKSIWTENNTYLDLFSIFPTDAPVLNDMFKNYIENVEKQEDNVDSYRIGLVDDYCSMNEYEKYKSTCCCGSDDVEIEVNGTTYMFGCNFGH